MDQAMTLYHYQDTDAPGLGANPEADRVALLHAILISGYGNKAAAGWTEESSSQDANGNLQHFTARQPWGNGLYVRVEQGTDLVIARDAENGGATEADLIDTLRAGLGTGYAPPEHEQWVALAGEASFYLAYARTGTGEPATGAIDQAACIWEGAVSLDDLAAHRDASTGHLVGGAGADTHILSHYSASSATAPPDGYGSIAIEGTFAARDPHWAALTAPAGRAAFGTDGSRNARHRDATLKDNRILLDHLQVQDKDRDVREYMPNVRFMLTGFTNSISGYSAADYPAIGDKVVIDGKSYYFAAPGVNGDTVNGAPNTAFVLFTEGS